MAIDLVATLRLEDRLSSSLNKVGIAATAGFAAIGAAATASVNKFVEFDTAIRRAGAVAGASASELDQLRQAALDLGASTSKSASEVAVAQTELASAGFETAEILGALPGVIAASEASGESLALSASTVGSALNIWSLGSEEATRVANVLAQAANASAADINALSYAFKYAGAPAAALKFSLEEVSAAVGLITNAGISGESAGTGLRGTFVQLLKNSDDLKKRLGVNLLDSQGEFRNLADLVDDIGAAIKNFSGADQLSVLTDLVGLEPAPAFLALINSGGDALRELTTELENSDGAAEATAKQIMAGLGGSLEEASGAIETAMILIGEGLSPAIQVLADSVADADFDPIIEGAVEFGEKMLEAANLVINNWDDIIETIINTAKFLGALTAGFVAFKASLAIGAAISAVIAFLAAYSGGATLAAAAQSAFNLSLAANPIGLVALAIGALIGAIVLLIANWDEVKQTTENFWFAIGEGQGIIALILGPLGFLINAGIDLATQWDSTKSIWENVWGAIKTSAETSVNAVIGLINTLIDQINKIPFVDIGNIGYKGASAASGQTNFRPLLGEDTSSNGILGSIGNTGRQTRPAVNTSLTSLPAIGGRNTLGINGSHANGLSNVPYDGYVASLHKGEEVLTRAEADQRRQQNSVNSVGTGGVTIAKLADQIIVREDADINRIADALVSKLMENRGGVTA